MNRFSGSYFNGIIYSNDRINNPPQMKAAVMGACKSVMVCCVQTASHSRIRGVL